MDKEKRILSYTISYLLIGLFICLIGISNVFAATYTPANYKAQLYDNINGSLSAKDTSLESTEFYYGFIGLTAYTSGGAWGISSPIPLIANHTYSMTVDPYVPGCGFTILSTVNRIGVGTSLSNAKSSYENNTNVTEKFSQAVSNSRYLQYVFTPSINASYIVFPYATTSTCSSTTNQLSNIVIEDLGEGSLSQEQINTSLNNQTTEIQTSIDNSTNTITGAIGETENNINSNIDDMEQAIVESNKETQEVIKDQFNNCNQNLIPKSSLQLGSIDLTDGQNLPYKTRIRTEYINVKSGINYNYSINSNYLIEYVIYYDDGFIGIQSISNSSGSISFNSDVKKVRFRIKNLEGTELNSNDIENLDLFFGSEEICTNKIDETNDKLDNLTGSITDSSSPNTSDLENSAGWLPPGPLDSILNLPLTMLNSLTNSLGKSCSPLNLTLPYVNKNIQIPCLSSIFAQITGVNGLWTWVGTIASVLILYNYLLNLYAWVDRVLTLRAEFDEAMGADLANWGRL